MATVKLARTTSCNRAIAYAEKRAVEKDGLNCEITNAKQEMTTVRELYAKNDKTQAHLCIQSFSPEESQKLGAINSQTIKRKKGKILSTFYSNLKSTPGLICTVPFRIWTGASGMTQSLLNIFRLTLLRVGFKL